MYLNASAFGRFVLTVKEKGRAGGCDGFRQTVVTVHGAKRKIVTSITIAGYDGTSFLDDYLLTCSMEQSPS